MNVCGIEMGDVAVIVGVDEEAVLLAMNAAVGDMPIGLAPKAKNRVVSRGNFAVSARPGHD